MPAQDPIHEVEAYSESCWALLQRVIASRQMKRSARMREFLLFVGKRSLKDGCDQIHEQEIGSEVFGRQPNYDTSVDNIVRVNATDLRKRIEDYFVTDGAHEDLILEIPRGSYKPVFRARAPNLRAANETERDKEPAIDIKHPETTVPSVPTGRWLLISAAVVIVALASVCSVLWRQNQAMRQPLYTAASTPAIASFWSGILGEKSTTDIILADTSFALIEDITKRPIPLNQYLGRTYGGMIQSPSLSQDRRDDLAMIVQRNYGSLGDFRVAQHIIALDPLAKNLHLYYARDYMPSLVTQDNVILIGSRKSNPWVDLFSARMNFTVEYDPNRAVSYVENKAPAKGEQAVYTSSATPDSNTGYSVVAYLPNQNHSGKVLVIAGTGSEATESAGQFLTGEDNLESFERLLHVKRLPYFEVLLKTTQLDRTPIGAKILAYRTYPDLK